MSVRTDDMDLVYDLKMDDKDGKISSRFNFRMDHTGRMNESQRKAWNDHYDPVIEEFMAADMNEEEYQIWKYQRYMRDYLACIKSVDENVGRLLASLEENGLMDQGFYLGEHGWFDKRFMYEESMRTPLTMRLPIGFETRGDITDLVQNIDYAPTFLDIAGINIPEGSFGKSMRSA